MADLKSRLAPLPVVMDTHFLTRSTVYRHLAAGDFRAVKRGRSLLINLDSVDEYFAALPPATFRAPAPKADQRAAA